jgi:hypothetical protein
VIKLSAAHTFVRLLIEAVVASRSNQGTAVMQTLLNRLGGFALITMIGFYVSTFGMATLGV